MILKVSPPSSAALCTWLCSHFKVRPQPVEPSRKRAEHMLLGDPQDISAPKWRGQEFY
jgi:hypothetical protein